MDADCQAGGPGLGVMSGIRGGEEVERRETQSNFRRPHQPALASGRVVRERAAVEWEADRTKRNSSEQSC